MHRSGDDHGPALVLRRRPRRAGHPGRRLDLPARSYAARAA